MAKRYYLCLLGLMLFAAPAQAATEKEKIEYLLSEIGECEGFVREGKEYTGAEAREELEKKWKGAGDKVITARQFISKVASHSPSGEPYKMHCAGQPEMESRLWLNEKLRNMR